MQLRSYVLLIAALAVAFVPSMPDVTHAQSNPFLPPELTDAGWPNICGPHLDGTSDEINLASHWPPGGPPVLWVKELGQGYSSFVAQGDRVYTQYQSLSGQYVVCLDADSGETIWTYRYDWPFEATGLYPGPRSTPTIAQGKVFFATPAGSVGCLSQDGDLIWSKELKTTYEGKGTDFGYACSPTVVNGKVLMPVGGRGASMVALNAGDGTLLWKSGDDPASYTPALPVKVGEQTQVIGYMQNAMTAYDLETGKQLWRVKLSNGYDEHSTWPLYREPYLWVTGPFQAGSQLYELAESTSHQTAPPTQNQGGMTDPDAAKPAIRLVHQSDTMSNDVASSVRWGNHIFGFDLHEAQSKAHRPSRGQFKCVDFLTGAENWSNGTAKSRRDPSDQSVIGHASLIVADGKLILLNDTGDLILARADPEKLVPLARATVLGGRIGWCSPCLYRGRLYLRNDARAVCIYVGEPGLLEESASASSVSVAEIPQGKVRDFSKLLGVEPEYAMDPPTRRWLIRWYVTSLCLLTAAFVLSWLCHRLLTRDSTSNESTRRLWYWLLAYCLAVVGGPILSIQIKDFVFTWPLCLFIAFDAAMHRVSISKNTRFAPLLRERERTRQVWLDRIAFIVMFLTCATYFYACRRLSLVTEWVFLCGFVGAIPLMLIGRWLSRRDRPLVWIEFLVTVAAFSAYYGVTVVFLHMKYEIPAY